MIVTLVPTFLDEHRRTFLSVIRRPLLARGAKAAGFGSVRFFFNNYGSCFQLPDDCCVVVRAQVP